ncbi:MAG: thioredoxin-disulfide reductase [Syntrophomonadaceae bacterium]|jgi:thioredoxin reductase (NADPH)|nr:thioredoxin-disulfide reductase [Syntrophomonadaceae bacterium]
MYDVIIVGAGPAGLTAAIYTGRAKLKTLIIESNIPGGNAGITDMIENYPGFPQGINGGELMALFLEQAENFGAELQYDQVLHIDSQAGIHTVVTSQGQYQARAIIIAAGARRRELAAVGEKEYIGKGVSYCATCDGLFFQNTPVAVVGGGDSAIKEALYLSDIASKVYLVHRREGFRANQTSLDKMLKNERIELKLNKIVKRVEGDDTMMKNLVLYDLNSKQEENLPVEGVFVSIGMIPASEFLGDLLELSDGYVVTDENMRTVAPGIFAAGDVRSKKLRQVSTAVGDGAVAAAAVTEFLKE